MKHGVGGTTKGHIECHTIVNCSRRNKVKCLNVLLYQLHYLHACLLCQANTLGIYRRNGAVARKRNTQRLGQTTNRICGKHARTAATRRTSGVFKPLALFFGHSARRYLTNRIKQGVEVSLITLLILTSKHRTARNQHRRNVQATSSKQHARNNFVARGNKYNTVKLMTLHHAFN